MRSVSVGWQMMRISNTVLLQGLGVRRRRIRRRVRWSVVRPGIVGLEPEFVRPKSIRVEWQLYELDTGELHRCPPKDDSHRDIDTPDFLASLLASHIARTRSKPCECHGLAYVFRGHGTANASVSRSGAKLVDVARRSGVSTGTVSNVLNRPDAVAEPTRLKVLEAVSDLGYIRNAASGELAAHWRRSGFATWLFRPATTGRYPGRGSQEERPVPVVAEPWPGIPARGRGASKRAEVCWVPIAPGLTPHGLRHTHKTLMREVGTPPKLMDERMGHEDGSVQSRYDHITPGMRQALMAALTGMWEEALDTRRTMSLGSPVAALDALLKARSSCHRSVVRPAFPVGREGLGRAGSAARLPTAMSPEWRNMMCHPYG